MTGPARPALPNWKHWRQSWPAGPCLRLAADELDQVLRLQEFRAAHPDVIAGTDEFGTWQARIPEPNGETILTRFTLRALLDKLDELTGQPDAD
jgi:hypothetical protein